VVFGWELTNLPEKWPRVFREWMEEDSVDRKEDNISYALEKYY
jgi:hypothetical protein